LQSGDTAAHTAISPAIEPATKIDGRWNAEHETSSSSPSSFCAFISCVSRRSAQTQLQNHAAQLMCLRPPRPTATDGVQCKKKWLPSYRISAPMRTKHQQHLPVRHSA
jgi:hypothetical protein